MPHKPPREHYGKPGNRLSPEIKQQVLDMCAAGAGRNEIAKALGIAAASVTGIVKRAGLSFDRTQTEAATKARQVDNAARRAALVDKLYTKAAELLEQIDQPHLTFSIGGKDNIYTEHLLDRPPTGDIRNLMQSTSIALQRAEGLERIDANAHDKPALDAWLDTMLGGAPSTPAP